MSGKKNSLNPVGKPRIYKTPEEFDAAVQNYFERGGIKLGTGELKLYTMSGLYVYIGLTKSGFHEYSKRPGYADSIKNARLRVEECIETLAFLGLIDKTMAVFSLKNNFGWQDKPEDKQSVSDGNPVNVNVNFADCRPKEEAEKCRT